MGSVLSWVGGCKPFLVLAEIGCGESSEEGVQECEGCFLEKRTVPKEITKLVHSAVWLLNKIPAPPFPP